MTILVGDCLAVLQGLESGSVQTCVTSPPYWGLRDYGTAEWEGGDPDCEHTDLLDSQIVSGKNARAGAAQTHHRRARQSAPGNCRRCGAVRSDSQLGLEATPEQYVEHLVEVFREVRRVLRDDGTAWLNLGDSYNGSPKGSLNGQDKSGLTSTQTQEQSPARTKPLVSNLKPKDLVGIPWRVAFALQADGWWLRSDVIWAKPNPMPESVTDRPTRSHEYVFLLTKSARYFYDAEAIREQGKDWSSGGPGVGIAETQHYGAGNGGNGGNGGLSDLASRYKDGEQASGRNRRTVWEVATRAYSEAHFATFPPKLIEPCVLAGSPPKCCAACGAPWKRVLERTPMVVRSSERSETQGDEVNDRRTATSGTMQQPPSARTIGWRSSCEHDEDSGAAVVLDPFAGAGTTGLVAAQQGRDFLGIELNPDYAAMAEQRIARWRANPAGALEGDADPIEGQLGLLG